MKRAGEVFTNEQRTKIAQTVARVESKTSAEIVPIIATSSGRYDRAEDLAGFIAAIAAFILAWLFFQREDPSAGGWGGLPLTLQLPVLVVILIVGFAGGALLTARVAWLRRLFTPVGESNREVESQASRLFFDHRIHHTDAGAGVLIYISMFERRAVVLADEQVLRVVGADAIRDACDALTADLRRRDMFAALKASIERLGSLLADALPREAGDANELDDVLITID